MTDGGKDSLNLENTNVKPPALARDRSISHTFGITSKDQYNFQKENL